MHRTTLTLLILWLVACSDDGSNDGANVVDAAGTPTIDGAGSQDAADASIGPDAVPNPNLSFFATSTGSGANGGDLGGLAGADAKCQSLGNAAGAGGRTWRAYLSTGATGPGPIVDARDRIGSGPWRNQMGIEVAATVADLNTNGIEGSLILTEKGDLVPGEEHDILTGSARDGSLFEDGRTCSNWTDGTAASQGQVGHANAGAGVGVQWNSEHGGTCSESGLISNAGAGRIYCFATD